MYIIQKGIIYIHLISLVHGVFKNPGIPVDDYADLGDLQLAYIGPLFFSSDNLGCRAKLHTQTAQDGQAVLWTIDKINNDSTLLPNITLGIILMNSCARGPVALARSLQVVPRTSCYSSLFCNSNWKYPVQPPWKPDEGLPSYDNVIGVIGPPSSGRAKLIASLFAAYQIPQISTWATSDALSDKATYPYFSRIIPPDRFQAQAMVSLLVHYNWTYISTINIAEDYGRNGINHVVTHARRNGICIAYSGEIHLEADESVYDMLVENLAKHPKARAVVLFLHGKSIRDLFLALGRNNQLGKYVMITTDAFTPISYGGIEHLFPGTFAIQPKFKHIKEFYDHLDTLPVIRNETVSFWEGMYTRDELSCTDDDLPGDNSTKCSDFKKVTEVKGFFRGVGVSRAMDAVLTFAYALDALIREKCPKAFYNKDELYQCFNSEEYLRQIRQVHFKGYTQDVAFDESGDIYGDFDITYFRDTEDDVLDNIVIGSWNRISDKVFIDEWLVKWYIKNISDAPVPESVCAVPCSDEEYYIQGEQVCCWECRRCRDYERIREDHQGCENCPSLMWPDEANLTSCIDISPTHMTWTDSLAIGLEGMAAFGIVGTLLISVIFIAHQDKKVIRGSGRELMAPITMGMLVAFLTVFAYLTMPSDWACYTSYFAFHLSCSFIFGPLFLKTLRIYRIFSAAERCETRVSMVNAVSQIGLTILLIAIQIGILIAVALFEPPGSLLQMPVRSVKYVELLCNMPLYSLIIPLSYNMLLLFLCAVFGFLTRKLPDNFNESWYVFISVATTIFIWVAFLPTYIMAFYAYHKAALLSFVLILNSMVTAMCLHSPKIYALFFVEESKIKITNFDTTGFDSATSKATSSTTDAK